MGLFDKFKKKPDAAEEAVAKTVTKNRRPVAFGSFEAEIDARFGELFPGREAFLFNEKIDEGFRVDIKVMEPVAAGNYYVLYTAGLSDLENGPRAELFCFLPASWNPVAVLEGGEAAPENAAWPIRMVRSLAGYARENETYLENGFVYPDPEGAAPICGDTKMCGYVLSQLEGGIGGVDAGETHIDFLMVIPAYREELLYRQAYGMDELNRRFDEGKLPMVTNLRRPNLCMNFRG